MMDTTRTMTKATAWLSALFLIIVLLVSAMNLKAESKKFNPDKFLAFIMESDQFWRAYTGCPARGYPPAIQCDDAHAQFDVAKWNKIQQDGHAIFGE